MDDKAAGLKGPGGEKKKVSWGNRLKLIGAIVGAILLVIIVFQNTKSVETRVLFMTITMPRALLLALTALIGFVLGIFVSASWFRGRDSPKSRAST